MSDFEPILPKCPWCGSMHPESGGWVRLRSKYACSERCKHLYFDKLDSLAKEGKGKKGEEFATIRSDLIALLEKTE